MPILYNLRRTADGYTMAKFDEDFNVAGIYNLSPSGPGLICDCPGYPRRNACKHTRMVLIFAKAGKIDAPTFYCYETQSWHQPIPAGPWDADSPTADRAAQFAADADAALRSITTNPTANEVSAAVDTLAAEGIVGASQPKPLRRI